MDHIILLTLLQEWGFPPHPYTCHTLFVSPIDGNHINTITKIHHVPSQEAPPLLRKSYDVHRPYDAILPSHIRGKYVNPKNPIMTSTSPTPPKHIYVQPSFDPI